MAATADKARYFLEQSIPELRELERKKIFSKDEISNIIRKRSDFEHKLNARGAKGTDFARYVEFEVNLNSLRKKRSKRLGIKSGQEDGNRRVFQVLERATRKFHGDLALWMQYLGVCRQQKSYNKINGVLSDVIRMHPTKPEVWIYAASYFMEDQGDIIEARSYMQRGLRFCKNSKEIWLTYAKLELLYIQKIHSRQKILGLSGEDTDKVVVGEVDGEDTDVIALPSLTAGDLSGTSEEAEEASKKLKELATMPALSGGIPMAIFDAAMDQFREAELGHEFFELSLEFRDLPCLVKIVDHIVTVLTKEHSPSPWTLDCFIRQPIAGVSTTAAEYPHALSIAFARLKTVTAENSTSELLQLTCVWIVGALKENPSQEIKQALLAILLRVLRSGRASEQPSFVDIAALTRTGPSSQEVLSVCMQVWPEDNLLTQSLEKNGEELTVLVHK